MYILDVSPKKIIYKWVIFIYKWAIFTYKWVILTHQAALKIALRGILRTISSTKSPFLGGSAASPSGKRTANGAQVDVTWFDAETGQTVGMGKGEDFCGKKTGFLGILGK